MRTDRLNEQLKSEILTGNDLPRMIVAPPGPESRRLAERLSDKISPASTVISAGQTPVFWAESRGTNVIDADGNRYIDLTAGFCVAVAGHSNPRISQAISEQANVLLHSQGGANPNPRMVELAEKLAEWAPGDLSVSYIANAGTEAIEMAIKTARLYTGKPNIIAFTGGYHGKTHGSLAVSSLNHAREPFLPQLPGVIRVPYADCYRCPIGSEQSQCAICNGDLLEYLLDYPNSGVSGVAAIIMEPVQGTGGWITPPQHFVQRVRRICDERGILLISDEIITGFGRTGRKFGMDNYGVVPDIIACGKGLASGFPISATITTEEISKKWESMQHTSTFQGNPVGCAAALASLAEIEEKSLVQRSEQLGKYFKSQLEALMDLHPLIGDVRGLGLMVGIEVVKDRETKEPASAAGRQVVEAALRRGVMATNYGGAYNNVIKMSPPLVISQEQLDYALNVLDECFSEVESTL